MCCRVVIGDEAGQSLLSRFGPQVSRHSVQIMSAVKEALFCFDVVTALPLSLLLLHLFHFLHFFAGFHHLLWVHSPQN